MEFRISGFELYHLELLGVWRDTDCTSMMDRVSRAALSGEREAIMSMHNIHISKMDISTMPF